MISNLKNLKGVSPLTKEEQKNVNGGVQDCRFTISSPDLDNPFTLDIGGFDDGSAGSGQANDACVEYLNRPGNENDRCFYDCEFDGFGV